MSLSATRDCLTVADLDFWFNYIEEFQEVFDAGVHYECSSSLYLSCLSLKHDSLEIEHTA